MEKTLSQDSKQYLRGKISGDILKEMSRKVYTPAGDKTLKELFETIGVLHRVRYTTRQNDGAHITKVTTNLGVILKNGHEIKGLAPCIYGIISGVDTLEQVERYSLKV